MKKNNILFLFLLITTALFSQPYIPAKGRIFDDSQVPRVDIIIDPDSLIDIYTNIYSDHEYPADFMFTDNTGTVAIANIGFRLRGNTSRTAAKKSFKISFNAFIPNQNFLGVEKLNLNGEHNDPSITRSKLYWETARRSNLPYSRANHVELYINGNYFGLYINVEHYDENFLQSRFGNKSGNFYKCLYPANLNYLGTNPNNYKLSGSMPRVYELKTNELADDYSDLSNFVQLLHAGNTPNYQSNLEEKFNVNSFLRAYALDILTGNWDNYAGNQNNFYLYHNPETDKIDYLPYDVDNTYGIDWLGKNWGTRSCYNWALDTANRPLVTRLFAYPDYVNRFSFFMNKMIQEAASTTNQDAMIDSILNLISPYVVNDTYHGQDYGYSYSDFIDSYNQTPGGHVKYGLKNFISTRNTNSLTQLNLIDVAPIFSETRHSPYAPYPGDSVYIKSWVEDELSGLSVKLVYKINSHGTLDTIIMQDNGLNKDGLPGDDFFGAGIAGSALGDTLFYFLTSTDLNSHTGREPRNGFFNIVVRRKPTIRINELMSYNASTLADNAGDFDDWFELYNASGNAESLSSIYVSDDLNRLGKWKPGNTNIPSNSYLLCWADEEGSEGVNHANFKLNNTSETLLLVDFNGVSYQILDSLNYQGLQINESVGCYPDGVKPFILQQPPSPGSSNMFTAIRELQTMESPHLFPNPSADFVSIQATGNPRIAIIQVYDIAGKCLKNESLRAMDQHGKFLVDTHEFHAGTYMIHVSIDGMESMHKLVLK